MSETDLFLKIDAIIATIDKHRCEPFLSNEIKHRNERRPSMEQGTNALFGSICEVIAYSGGAKSALVEPVIRDGLLKEAFAGYDVEVAVSVNPLDVIEKHWKHISPIRKKTKVFHALLVARALSDKGGGMSSSVSKAQIPAQIESIEDIDRFWLSLKALRRNLIENEVPYVGALTSLLHLLLDMGYDCAKPDSGVLKAAAKLGIVRPREDAEKFKDADLELTIRELQRYSLARKIRPPVGDMLIEGGQTWARQYVDDSYRALLA